MVGRLIVLRDVKKVLWDKQWCHSNFHLGNTELLRYYCNKAADVFILKLLCLFSIISGLSLHSVTYSMCAAMIPLLSRYVDTSLKHTGWPGRAPQFTYKAPVLVCNHLLFDLHLSQGVVCDSLFSESA